jgi:K(+)-stimulated pyrophosphate-energized sodium pump
VNDFYNIGFFGLGLVCGMIQLFPVAIGGSSVDNAKGCKKMLSPNDPDIATFSTFESIASVGVCVVNNIISVTTLISGTMFTYFYVSNVKKWLTVYAKKAPYSLRHLRIVNELEYEEAEHLISTADLNIRAVFELFDVNLLNPKLMIGLFLGAGVVFLAIALIFHAIELNVSGITRLMRKEFSEKPGIWEGKILPDYEKVLSFSITKAQKWMIIISVILLSTPVFVSAVIGVTGAIGFLIGLFITASLLSLFFNLSGTAWKNAQKLIEFEDPNFLGTNKHISACVGSNIGDTFKDGIAPVLSIILQILALMLVFLAPVALRNADLIQM